MTNGTIAGARCLARKVAAGSLKAVNWFSRLHATLRWTGSCSQHFVAAGKLAGVTTTAATVDTDFPAADSVVNNTRHLQQQQSFSHHLLMWAAQANQPCPRRAPRSWVLRSRAVGGGGTRQLQCAFFRYEIRAGQPRRATHAALEEATDGPRGLQGVGHQHHRHLSEHPGHRPLHVSSTCALLLPTVRAGKPRPRDPQEPGPGSGRAPRR